MATGRARLAPIGWVIVSVLALGGCLGGKSQSTANQPKNVAVVNGEPITLDEFQRALSQDKEDGVSFLTDNETARRIKRDLLERLIDTRLLVQEAQRKHLAVDPKLVTAAMDLTAKRYPEGQLQEELLKKGKTPEIYRQETADLLLLNQLLRQEVVDRIAISKEDVEKYYQGHQQEFIKPEEVRVRQIVTRTEDEAKDLRQKILQGTSFEELARKFSLGPEGEKGGDLGYFPRGRMPPAIDQACFELWSNRVSQVVASPYGFHLFQLVDRRAARTLSLQEARSEIERTLTAQKSKEVESYFVHSLREKASIERDLNLLDWAH